MFSKELLKQIEEEDGHELVFLIKKVLKQLYEELPRVRERFSNELDEVLHDYNIPRRLTYKEDRNRIFETYTATLWLEPEADANDYLEFLEQRDDVDFEFVANQLFPVLDAKKNSEFYSEFFLIDEMLAFIGEIREERPLFDVLRLVAYLMRYCFSGTKSPESSPCRQIWFYDCMVLYWRHVAHVFCEFCVLPTAHP
jgi:hypothetical protein